MRKIVLVLVALLLVSGAALAQEATPESHTFCGDLSEADCTLLTQSEAAMKTLESAAFDLQADVTISGIEEMNTPVAFTITGNGAYHHTNPGMMADMAAMQGMMQNPTEMITWIVDALRSFSGELSLTLTLPQELVAQAEDVPESITLELRMVDGIGYINFDTLAAAFGDMTDQMQLSGWGGLDIASLLEAAVEQHPEMFNQMNMSGMDMSMYQQFSDMSTFGQYVTIERTDDGSGDTATFVTTVDMAGLMSDPAIMDLIREQMDAQGQTFSEEEMQQGLAAAQALYANSTVTSTTTIEVSTGYVTTSSFSATFDMSGMMSMMATEEAGMSSAPVFTMNASINYSQFNDAPEITAPEDANMLPYESLLGMMNPNGMPGGMATPEAEATPRS